MTVCTCDRCGKTLDYYGNQWMFSPVTTKHQYIYSDRIRKLDLCDECCVKVLAAIDEEIRKGDN